tara:strand:+ start:143 stop:853 length:711 start_codon:yes stop_codon:yes gene_type:complete
MQLIVLAAGKGSRLPNKFRNKPKCMTEINGKSILEHNKSFFLKFKKRIIITGYKSKLINNYAKKNNFRIIKNKNYSSTNMVYSLFLAKKFVNDDVLVCYGDIIFDSKIFNVLNKFNNLVPLNMNWLSLWKKRMNTNLIKKDAENVKIKNKQLIEIGTKFKKFPDCQFMGLIKISKNNFFVLENFFKSFCNKKIDMTNFLNFVIKNKICKFYVQKVKNFWFEIDTHNDIKITSKILR